MLLSKFFILIFMNANPFVSHAFCNGAHTTWTKKTCYDTIIIIVIKDENLINQIEKNKK
jgi:hypothetical protein